MELKVKRVHKDARLPVYGHKGDAGLDIFSVNNCILEPGRAFPVPTGIKIALPKGYVGLIWDKSGISLSSRFRVSRRSKGCDDKSW
jgi:dUTP pyrophosphatase